MFNNSTGNATAEESVESNITWVEIFVGVTLYLITLATVFGNVLVLIAVKVNKRLQTKFNYYIVNLAITDVAVAITAMSFKATDTFLGFWPFGEILCASWIFFDYGMTFVSVFTLIVISVDRFWSVKWSVHYHQRHTKRICLFAIFAVWMFMILLWFPPWLVDRIRYSEPGTCYWNPSLNKEFVFILAVLGHHGPFFIMVYCYTYVFIFLHKHTSVVPIGGHNPMTSCASKNTFVSTITESHSCIDNEVSNMIGEKLNSTSSNKPLVNTLEIPRRFKEQQNSQTRESKVQRRMKRERKIFVTMTYIIVAYAVLWLPFHVVYDISIVDPNLIPEGVLNLVFWMTYFNSTVNPLLYNFSSSEFRITFKRILTLKCN